MVPGGTSLFGGKGTVIGTVLGLAILQTIANGMVAARIVPWWQTITIDAARRRIRPAG